MAPNTLKEAVRARIYNDMLDPLFADRSFRQLIVDDHTMKLLSGVVKVSDLMDHGVAAVEKLEIPRQPLALEAIYFIAPVQASVSIIIDEFEKLRRGKPQYPAIHIFFSTYCPDQLIETLSTSKAVKYIKTLKELNYDFSVVDTHSFSLIRPDALYSMYSPAGTRSSAAEYSAMAARLVSVCTSLGEVPIIRHSTDSVATRLAGVFQLAMESERKRNTSLKPSADRGTLLILERTFDLATPLTHELTFEAMIRDLLPIKNDTYLYKGEDSSGAPITREALFDDEKDQLWAELRHMHIADVSPLLDERFNSFKSTNIAAKHQSERDKQKQLTSRELSDLMRSMPRYKDQCSQYSMHINLAGDCMAVFNARECLEKMIEVEQQMVTGETADHKKPANLTSSLTLLLRDPAVTLKERLRLLMLYFVTQENILEKDRRMLLNVASIPSEYEAAILNLGYLGATLQSEKKTKLSKLASVFKKKDKPKNTVGKEVTYDLSRYTPRLKDTLTDFFNNSLSSTDFAIKDGGSPIVSDLGSAKPKSSLATWHQGPSQSTTPKPSDGPRLIVFIIGGVSYSELRAAAEVSKSVGRDILVGSTEILTPDLFIENVKKLKPYDLPA